MAARGLDAIPAGAFPYREDAGALFDALLEYATDMLAAHYGSGTDAAAALKGDAQLQAFLTDLSEGGDGEVRSFPGPADVNSVADLARAAAKVTTRPDCLGSSLDWVAHVAACLCSLYEQGAGLAVPRCKRCPAAPACLQVMWMGGVQHHALNSNKVGWGPACRAASRWSWDIGRR